MLVISDTSVEILALVDGDFDQSCQFRPLYDSSQELRDRGSLRVEPFQFDVRVKQWLDVRAQVRLKARGSVGPRWTKTSCRVSVGLEMRGNVICCLCELRKKLDGSIPLTSIGFAGFVVFFGPA
jgi:hypothetical protein